ncbi:MAG: YIP1 family protein, partial [Pyrinomonadaceae bacterium]
GTGISLILLGALLFGLSFVPKPENSDTSGEMSAFERLTKIFYAPTEVFQNLRRHPRWFVAVLIISILSAAYSTIFYNYVGADKITNYTVDKVADSGWVPADKVADMRREQLEASTNPIARAGTAVSGFVGQTFFHAFLGLVFFLFALAMGGKLNYWQAFSVSVYAAFPVGLIRYVLSSGLIYLKDPSDIHPILGQTTLLQDNLSFLVIPSEHPTLFVLLAAIGILSFYWLWLCATGIKNTGERVSSTIGWSAAIFIFLAQLLLGIISSLVFPKFF